MVYLAPRIATESPTPRAWCVSTPQATEVPQSGATELKWLVDIWLPPESCPPKGATKGCHLKLKFTYSWGKGKRCAHKKELNLKAPPSLGLKKICHGRHLAPFGQAAKPPSACCQRKRRSLTFGDMSQGDRGHSELCF